jgi:hypothetical protein
MLNVAVQGGMNRFFASDVEFIFVNNPGQVNESIVRRTGIPATAITTANNAAAPGFAFLENRGTFANPNWLVTSVILPGVAGPVDQDNIVFLRHNAPIVEGSAITTARVWTAAGVERIIPLHPVTHELDGGTFTATAPNTFYNFRVVNHNGENVYELVPLPNAMLWDGTARRVQPNSLITAMPHNSYAIQVHGDRPDSTGAPMGANTVAFTTSDVYVVDTRRGSGVNPWQIDPARPMPINQNHSGLRTNFDDPDYGAINVAFMFDEHGLVSTIFVTSVALPFAPGIVITTQPASQTVAAGTNATFTVVATPATATFQWQVDDGSGAGFVNIPGATSASWTVVNPQIATHDGNQYRVVVTNQPTGTQAVTLESAPATLTVT